MYIAEAAQATRNAPARASVYPGRVRAAHPGRVAITPYSTRLQVSQYVRLSWAINSSIFSIFQSHARETAAIPPLLPNPASSQAKGTVRSIAPHIAELNATCYVPMPVATTA